MKKIVHFALLILSLNFCFLFSPKPMPDADFCGEYISINSYSGFVRNCDATGFLEGSMDASVLIREHYVRQNRPLYVLVASGVGYVIYGASNFLNVDELVDLEKSMYAAYVLLNFIILLLSLILFEKIAMLLTENQIPYRVMLMLSVFIASNFMTKAFFWTVHQQMLAFLMPLLGIYVVLKWIKESSVLFLYVLFLLFGIGMLLYGSFLILFTVCIAYLCYAFYKEKKIFSVSLLIRLFGGALLFLAPTVLWILFLNHKGIAYYNHEVEQYRQLVWMMDTLSVSFAAFLSALYVNVLDFFKTLPKLYLFMALFCITAIARKIKSGVVLQWDQNTKAILLNLVCFGCFFVLLGYYANRLTFTLMPILLCLIVVNAGDLLKNKKVQIGVLAMVSIWHLINVISYGPFS